MKRAITAATVGAVLAYAVHVDLDAVDLAMVGRILVVVGITGAVVELALVRSRAQAARVVAAQRTTTTLPPAQPSSWPVWDTRELTPGQHPRREP